jgi:hypothetical protein
MVCNSDRLQSKKNENSDESMLELEPICWRKHLVIFGESVSIYRQKACHYMYVKR